MARTRSWPCGPVLLCASRDLRPRPRRSAGPRDLARPGAALRSPRPRPHHPGRRRLRPADAPAGRGHAPARPHPARPPAGGPRGRALPRRALGQVIVISDTFHEFSEPLLQKLGGHALFANRFELDERGALKGFKLRIRGQKERIVSGFHGAGFRVAAVGDSLNDLSLLKSCDYPVLFRPVEALRVEFPDAPVARDLDQALAHLETAWRRDVERDGG